MAQPLVFDLNVNNKDAIDSINAFFQIYEKGVAGLNKDLSATLGQPVEKKVMLTMENGKAIAKEVEVVNKQTQQVLDITKALNKEYGKTPNELKRQLQALQALQGNTKKYYDNTQTVTKSWEQISAAIKGVRTEVKNLATKDIGNLNKALLQSALEARAVEGAFSGIVSGISGFFQAGQDMEVLFLQLKGFTGSTEEASAAYKEFIEIGQATPFRAADIAEASKVMMGFGVATGDAIVEVERLAVVAAATGGDINNMARNMGQIVANQRAYTRDLNQFAIQGIPIYTELAKVIGVNGEQIREMVEAGTIGYDQVSQALRNMTAEGTAFRQIADEMDATFSARMEAIGSAVDTLAGRFMNMINAFDRATGGFVSGALQLLINGLNLAGDAMEFLANNARQLAPVLGGLAGAVAAVSFLTIAQNIGAIVAAMATWKITTIAVTAANWLLYASQLAVQAAMGNMPVVIGAIAVAATGATIAANMMGEAIESTNTALQTNQELAEASGDEMDTWAWKVEGLPGKLKAAMNSMKADWESYRAELKEVQVQQDNLMAATEASSKAELDGIKDVIKEIKERQKVLREAHSEQMKDLRERHAEEMKSLDKEIAAERKKHDARMGLLDQEGPAEKQLAAYRREELEMRAKGIEFQEDEARLNHKKKLEAQAELDRLDRRAAMDKEKLQFDEKMVQFEKDKKDLQEQQGQERDKLAKQQDKEKDHLTEMEKLQEWNYENTKKRWDDLKQQQSDMWTEDKANSNLSIDQANYRTDYLVTLENEIRDAMVKKWDDATVAMNRHYDQQDRRANAPGGTGGRDGTGRASGGPVSGGTTYTVNELGKEAFLSASGKLSMINAPSYGQWKAPSSGTVIPAHLTSQLDIPVGGVNINKTAGMNARGIGGVRSAAISHGDSIMNNVTVQSTNPGKTASDMLVSMTKIRRRRLR